MNKLLLVAAFGGLVSMSGAFAAYTGPKVELTFLEGFTGSDRPIMEQMIANYNKTHENVQVKVTAQPWGTTWDQLEPLVASGKAPDVVVVNEDQITRFAARGALTPLLNKELQTAGINKSIFFPVLIQSASYKGLNYGLPIQSISYVNFYNKDLMKKMGVAKVPTTQAEFLTATKACTTDASGKHPGETGFDAKNLSTWGVSLYNNWVGSRFAYSVMLQNGGMLVDKQNNPAFNSPQAVQAIQFLVDLVSKYNVARANSTEEAELAAFKQGKVCFFPSGQWYTDAFQNTPGLNFGVSFLPRLGSVKDAAWGGSGYMTLPKQRSGYDANRRAAALDFFQWMTQPAQNLFWTQAGSLPTQATVAKDPKFATQAIGGIFNKLGSIYATTGFPWGGQILGPWDAAWERAYLGKQDVKASLDQGVAESLKQVAAVRANFK